MSGTARKVGQELYGQRFYGVQADGSARSAARIVPIVRELLHPTSVLDVGCGVGTWLAEWQVQGVDDVVGVDGDYVDRSDLRIPADNFVARDLEQPLSLGRRFDLVMTLEVAEHITSATSATFVKSLVEHADVVLFSAAVPGQGGTGHINEQWPSYWASLFRVHGYRPLDVLRPMIWEDAEVVHWYRQNLLIFASEAAPDLNCPAAVGPLDLAHPELFMEKALKPLRQQIDERIRRTGIPARVKAAAKSARRR
jgi:hypothetical protein